MTRRASSIGTSSGRGHLVAGAGRMRAQTPAPSRGGPDDRDGVDARSRRRPASWKDDVGGGGDDTAATRQRPRRSHDRPHASARFSRATSKTQSTVYVFPDDGARRDRARRRGDVPDDVARQGSRRGGRTASAHRALQPELLEGPVVDSRASQLRIAARGMCSMTTSASRASRSRRGLWLRRRGRRSRGNADARPRGRREGRDGVQLQLDFPSGWTNERRRRRRRHRLRLDRGRAEAHDRALHRRPVPKDPRLDAELGVRVPGRADGDEGRPGTRRAR